MNVAYICLDLLTMMELRKQAVRVGLINAKTMRSLRFFTESEASALYCVGRKCSTHRNEVV